MKAFILEYLPFFAICFFSVTIIKYVFVNMLEKYVKSKYDNYEKILISLKTYTYWLFPTGFSVLGSLIKPIDPSFYFNFICYYGVMMLIFNVLFKTIINKIENKIKGM